MKGTFIDSLDFFADDTNISENYWIVKPSLLIAAVSPDNFKELSETFYSLKDRKIDQLYLEMAKTWSINSYCERMKVGSLIVKDKSIISDGYNGSPTGFPNICEDSDNNTLPHILHAEANAITKLAKSTQSSNGSSLYVTVSPCFECSKLIIQSGIKRLIFRDLYRNVGSLKFLFDAGIEIVRLNNK